MNQFNDLYGDEPNEPPINWSSQPPASHFKSRTSPSKTSPVVSAITGILNNNAVDNGDVKIHTSYFPVEFNSESFTYPDTNKIKSIDDDEMYHLLELFHSGNDEDLLDVDLHILQA